MSSGWGGAWGRCGYQMGLGSSHGKGLEPAHDLAGGEQHRPPPPKTGACQWGGRVECAGTLRGVGGDSGEESVKTCPLKFGVVGEG